VSERQARIVLCGPFPGSGMVGGYARVNEFIASSELGRRIGIVRLPISLPHEGRLAARLVRDVRHARAAVRRPGIRVFHLTAQYHTGTYREWLQYRIAHAAGCAFLLDIRGGCFASAYEDPASPIQRRLLDDMLRGAEAITVEGRPDAAWIERRFGRSAAYFPNFVRAADRTRIAPAALTRPGPGERLRLAYSGQLRAEKGLLELVEACALLHRRGVAVCLDLAGVGDDAFVEELRARTAQLPADSVRFLGRLDHAALLGALREAHVFVFPSRWRCEGHSNAVNEAMQVGLPIVATRQGFTADVVGPDCGRLVDAPAPGDLADAIARLAADWDALVACGHAARARVYEEFTDEIALASLEAVYRQLLDRHGAPGPSSQGR
jgi:glycosyltransferase involved in cell wall biosynthesis